MVHKVLKFEFNLQTLYEKLIYVCNVIIISYHRQILQELLKIFICYVIEITAYPYAYVLIMLIIVNRV